MGVSGYINEILIKLYDFKLSDYKKCEMFGICGKYLNFLKLCLLCNCYI